MRKLLPLALFLNAALASAAPLPGKLPGAPLTPVFAVVPARLPMLVVTQLPSVKLPALHEGLQLPGKPSPLPLPLPAQLAEAPLAAPLAAAADGAGIFFLRWDLLDGDDDGLAGAMVPANPGPKPLPPAGAMAQLESAPAAPEQVFDALRPLAALAR